MTLYEIEETLGESTVDALLLTLLSIIADDPGDSQYVERVRALQNMLTAAIALCITRSGKSRSEAAAHVMSQIRSAVDHIERSEIASRETGVLSDIPDEWLATLARR